MKESREQWSSKLGFILSSAGAAIGLGAIWKFPYATGMNGGGAFFLVFVLFTIFIGLPMLISEFIIGRGAKREAVSAYDHLAPNSSWRIIGRLGVVGCFLLLSFYSVVGGWIVLYSGLSLTGNVIKEGANYGALFDTIIGTPWMGLGGLAIFLLINVIVLLFGIKNGIEKASKYLMPLLFIFFIILVVRSITLDGAMAGIEFFLSPDFSRITGEGILYALGQSFFSLAVGFSCMVTYSSYLSKQESIPNSAGSVVTLNILVSLLAGLAIFPVVFAFGLEPAAGPGLLFVVLPTVFSQMAFGSVFLALFLLLFLFATLTSSFSLLEIIISAFIANKNYTRRKVTLITGCIVFLASIPAALSFGVLADVSIFGKSVFDATDFLVSNILLPLGSLLIAIFISFRMDQAIVMEEFRSGSKVGMGIFKAWRFLMRYVVPVTILIVFIYSLGFI
ncbi:sodium-dependent transporter [Virgibacillus halodenitrificans]|uniref:Transporter n=1 Tax=Virgibacillus halodenitrificans TaxID=1482 RepID=A0AAC9NKF5_VIRHA|nr:sodium-dependent transporter [Virgibacillus halodenitrificans]APC47845.1 hypothetical protein BME96_06525 [Virgibacillus halodenitrificans]MCJ0933262.1 sodium-dependent transporter [Virgibacillus halodenitrificans]MEC2160094.1 sodium-dependent transporter [Virgibacillus halodenitrificans]MYL44939.1 hypothetical protein [Virgibacillus halodenitrificans]WHX27937.1 sodium-dependent transporter [Virgibacillus halodenitrificans]